MTENNQNNPVVDAVIDIPSDSSRRQFFQTAGAIGAIGALGAAVGASLGSTTANAQTGNQSSNILQHPDGLLPGGQSDSRFPVSFADPVANGLRLVMEYFTALNQRDLPSIARTLHFPVAFYEDIEPIVYQSESDFLSSPPPCLSPTSNRALGQRALLPGSYDLLEGVNVHLYCPVGGAFSLKFTRFTPDGHKLMECDNMISVTNNDGRWAIQLISGIFHEAGYEKNSYPDAEVSYRLGSQGYLAAFGYRDEALLNDRLNGRGSGACSGRCLPVIETSSYTPGQIVPICISVPMDR